MKSAPLNASEPLVVKAGGGTLQLKVSDDGLGVYVSADAGFVRMSRFIPTTTVRRVWAWLGEVLGHPVVPS